MRVITIKKKINQKLGNFVTILSFILILILANNNSCQAFSLPFAFPFFSKDYQIIFTNSKYKKELEDIIKETLKNANAERDEQKVNLNPEQISLIEQTLIEKLLFSKGFYDAKATVETVSGNKKSDKNKENIYKIDSGEPYLIKKITIKSEAQNIDLPSIKELNKTLEDKGYFLRENTALIADQVLIAQKTLEEYIQQNYCLWQIKVNYNVKIDRQNKRAEILFTLQASKQVQFGELDFNGLTKIKKSYLKNKIIIKKDSCFKNSIIENAKLELLKTGLFATVEANLAKTPEEKINVNFNLKERRNKTIKAGLAFNSTESFILSTGLEHRNILGKAEDLQFNLQASKLSQTLGLSLNIPSFLNSKQNLIISEDLSKKNFSAFYSQSSDSAIILKRKLTDYLTAGVGSNLTISQVKDQLEKQSFRLLSTPLTLEYDRKNRDLNPDHGFFVGLKTGPYFNLINDKKYFIKSSSTGTYYHKFDHFLNPILALKLALGSIENDKTTDVPADEKFYIGGGNSIRGYGFQKAGLLKDGLPFGGFSFLEFSTETRLKISENWGAAVFIDAGNNFNQSLPNFRENLKWSAGFGVRHFIGLLPIRIDIAFPFQRREKIDSAFQIYIGIGQAF